MIKNVTFELLKTVFSNDSKRRANAQIVKAFFFVFSAPILTQFEKNAILIPLWQRRCGQMFCGIPVFRIFVCASFLFLNWFSFVPRFAPAVAFIKLGDYDERKFQDFVRAFF